MSFRRTFRDGVRQQVARESESAQVRLFRFNAAGLSIAFGIIGLVLFLPIARGLVSWAAAPGCVVMLAGGLLGVGAQRSSDVAASRRLGLWAVIATIVGLAEVGVVLALAA